MGHCTEKLVVYLTSQHQEKKRLKEHNMQGSRLSPWLDEPATKTASNRFHCKRHFWNKWRNLHMPWTLDKILLTWKDGNY